MTSHVFLTFVLSTKNKHSPEGSISILRFFEITSAIEKCVFLAGVNKWPVGFINNSIDLYEVPASYWTVSYVSINLPLMYCPFNGTVIAGDLAVKGYFD